MNFSNIITEIEKLDPEVYERTSERREVIKSWGRKIAMASLPFALGSLFKKAYGKGTGTIADVLNYALTLEYLESEFYKAALASPSLIFPRLADKYAIANISVHETQHVTFLTNTITAMGAIPVSKPLFDFSGGSGSGTGPFGGAFSDYSFFLAVAQTLEDTGVRAYKGAAPDLSSDNAVLTAALTIHSVEARHASQIRQMRRAAGVNTIKPWITLNQSGVSPNALVADNYNGEENTMQANVDIAGIKGVNGVLLGNDIASESFDEPLTMVQVLTLVTPFIKP